MLDSFIRNMVDIDEMQFSYVPGRGSTDAIFIVRQLQEKHIAAKKPLYFAFVDLEKAFDRALVGIEKSWCGGMGCPCHPGHVHERSEPGPC